MDCYAFRISSSTMLDLGKLRIPFRDHFTEFSFGDFRSFNAPNYLLDSSDNHL